MTPEVPSKSPREELKDMRRKVDQRLLAETTIDDQMVHRVFCPAGNTTAKLSLEKRGEL